MILVIIFQKIICLCCS